MNVFDRRGVLKVLAALPLLNLPSETFASGTLHANGPLRPSLCRWCFSSLPLPSLIQLAKKLGVESIELLDPSEWEVVIKAGLTCAVANGPSNPDVGFNREDLHAKLVPQMIRRLQEAASVGIPNVICFPGKRGGLNDTAGLDACERALKQITPVAEACGVTVLMELLNSKVDHPDYMGDRTSWGVELVKRVNSPRFKLLFDVYHMQIMEGDIIATVRRESQHIGHYHVAGVPGRHEPNGSQELNYRAITRAIVETGYRGYIAQEFLPSANLEDSLREALEICSCA